MTSVTPTARNKSLDGLRALAVAAVISYHLVPSALPGGFLGVDLFFVLSGYLITRLLAAELLESGRVDLRAFWTRRLRRLVPALIPLMLVTLAAVSIFPSEAGRTLKLQVLGAATFSTNWLQVADQGTYFAESEPPMLLHLWSLAVEEQFYLVWPLVLLILWKAGAKGTVERLPVWMALVVLVSGLGSAGLMAVLFDPAADPSRLYFGTDTHGFGLLLGAALALASQGVSEIVTPGRSRVLLPLSLAALIVFFFVIPDSGVPAYRGGMVAFTAVCALIIALLIRPSGPVAELLATRRVQWLGRRSYGVYLWHWPLIVLVQSWLPVGSQLWVAVIVIPLTLGCAELSWRFVELPVLRNGFVGALKRLFQCWSVPRLRPVLAVSLSTCTVAAMLAGSAVALSPDSTQLQEQVEAGQAAAQAAATQQAAPSAPASPAPSEGAEEAPAVDAPEAGQLEGPEVTALGDSVMLASAPQLASELPGIDIRAGVGQQMVDAPGTVSELAQSGELRDQVVIGLGTNGDFDAAVLEQVRDAVGPDRVVTVVTAHGPRDWIGSVNRKLVDFAQKHDNVELADWDAAALSVPDFAQDGIHPGPEGGQVYADLIGRAPAE
ncbi:acyltransferase family protein [Arthrobacter sp. H5]|uniref:acyltransferase family protein n=1 Tax=Arthrobacter sp. H5 TaxID=1267973 RepID=UPI0004B13FB4|nr:acyltransferase family protein [Arthrobacter sp. H5]